MTTRRELMQWTAVLLAGLATADAHAGAPERRYERLLGLRDELRDVVGDELPYDAESEHLLLAIMNLEHAIMRLCPHDRREWHPDPHDAWAVSCPHCRARSYQLVNAA